MSEFNLSDRGVPIKAVYFGSDVKEFIKRLKKLLFDGDYYGDRSFTDLFKKIDKLAGEDLI